MADPSTIAQAAFKRPAAAEVTSASTPEVGVDWDNVKAEDKTLVYQVDLLLLQSSSDRKRPLVSLPPPAVVTCTDDRLCCCLVHAC